MEAREDLQPIFLRDKDRKTHMGTSLKQNDREAIGKTLTKNADLFAWTAADMPGVKSDVITHRLSVYKEARLIAQKKRKLGEERRKAARIPIISSMKSCRSVSRMSEPHTSDLWITCSTT